MRVLLRKLFKAPYLFKVNSCVPEYQKLATTTSRFPLLNDQLHGVRRIFFSKQATDPKFSENNSGKKSSDSDDSTHTSRGGSSQTKGKMKSKKLAKGCVYIGVGGLLFYSHQAMTLNEQASVKSHAMNSNIAFENRLDDKYKVVDKQIVTLQEVFTHNHTIDASMIKSIQTVLNDMVKIDQEMRELAISGLSDKDQLSAMEMMHKIDSKNTANLKLLLKLLGKEWFTISEFGKECDQNAWLLVQHADLDVQFQSRILPILEKLMKQGETIPKNYAYLYDRIASHTGKPQRYGTQANGDLELFPVEDPVNLNRRRAEVGLPPIEEQMQLLKIKYGKMISQNKPKNH